MIDLPSSLFPNTSNESRISTRIAFDSVQQTLQSVDLVNMLEDGIQISTHIQPVYQEHNGEPVKIGLISVIDTKFESLIEGFDSDIEYFDSLDEIPEISKEDFNLMEQEGIVYETPPLKFGNPADLSYQETIIELYKDIKVNEVSNAVFRVLEKGEL